MAKKLREVLRTEADWCKGATHDGTRCCLVGACEEATKYIFAGNGYLEFVALCDKLRAAICDLYPDRADVDEVFIPDFNDHPDTTFDDVCKVIEKAGV